MPTLISIDRHRPLDALKIADLSRAQTLEQGLAAPAWKQKIFASTLVQPPGFARRLTPRALLLPRQQHSYVWVIYSRKDFLSICCLQALRLMRVKSYRQSFLIRAIPWKRKCRPQATYARSFSLSKKIIRRIRGWWFFPMEA